MEVAVSHENDATVKKAAEPGGKRRRAGQVGEWILKILGIFVILEPIWMLLPFAGFLYGSVFHIHALNRNASTAWLTHFVFPVLTLGPLGPVLIAVGFLLFLAGAAQIYWAKIRKSGLVGGGLYRFVRHPQYISLTLFGFGILLTWGRAITFLAFFFMMFLYYYLAKTEERNCIRLFGEAYERYREKTSFIFPGDRFLRPLGAKLEALPFPAPLRVGLAFFLSLGLCFGLMWLVQTVKETVHTVPHLTATVAFERVKEVEPAHGPALPAVPEGAVSERVGSVSIVHTDRIAVVRGPHRTAAAPGFAERVLRRLPGSRELADFLGFLKEPGSDGAVVFCLPFSAPERPGTPGMHADPGRKGPPPDPDGSDRARLMIMRVSLSQGATLADAFRDKAKRRIIRACIAPVNLGASEGAEIVDGRVIRPGRGFPGEERWGFLVGQLEERETVFPDRSPEGPVEPKAATGRLVLVKAPILRTRIDPAFAEAILDRLRRSPSFMKMLKASGVGGPVVAVAFPRPGPNWYEEYHDMPQISLFVVLVRLKEESLPAEAVFDPKQRDLVGAFTAEMDFAVDEGKDSIGETAVIGPRRDLEERWRFFLSGV